MKQPSTPFDTIESAHEFFALLSATISDAKQEVTSDVKRERTDGDRRRPRATSDLRPFGRRRSAHAEACKAGGFVAAVINLSV